MELSKQGTVGGREEVVQITASLEGATGMPLEPLCVGVVVHVLNGTLCGVVPLQAGQQQRPGRKYPTHAGNRLVAWTIWVVTGL